MLAFDLGPTPWHLALSDALARHGEMPTVWWHATEHPTLILGPGQTLQDVEEWAVGPEVLVVKRQAGGTAVLASADMLGLDVFLPAGHPLITQDVVETYRWLGMVWRDTMHSLGAPSHLVSIREARQAAPSADAPIRLACFGTLSPYEVTSGERKLVGLAQIRRRGGVLLQSALHLHFDPTGLAGVLSADCSSQLAAGLSAAAVGLDEAAGTTVEATAVAERFQQVLTTSHGVSLELGSWAEKELDHARLVLGRYEEVRPVRAASVRRT